MFLFVFILWKSWDQKQPLLRVLSGLMTTASVVDVGRAACLYGYVLECSKDPKKCTTRYLYKGGFYEAINWLFTVFLITNSVAYWLFSFKYFYIA